MLFRSVGSDTRYIVDIYEHNGIGPTTFIYSQTISPVSQGAVTNHYASFNIGPRTITPGNRIYISVSAQDMCVSDADVWLDYNDTGMASYIEIPLNEGAAVSPTVTRTNTQTRTATTTPTATQTQTVTLTEFPTPTFTATAGGLYSLLDFYVVSGFVHAAAETVDSIYLGGDFNYVGPRTGSLVIYDTSAGTAVPGRPEVTGSVIAAVPDGSGGWYIGGAFTHVAGIPRAGIARILANGSLDPVFNPGDAGSVNALLLDANGLLYVGGAFTTIGGQAVARLARLDAVTGAVDMGFTPNPSAAVSSLQFGPGGVLYAAGDFATIGSQSRPRLAKLNISDGTVDLSFNVNTTGAIVSISYDAVNSKLYAGGNFTSIGGQTRNRIACLDPYTGSATSWNPNSSGQIGRASCRGTVFNDR